jgi:hypothetical protein
MSFGVRSETASRSFSMGSPEFDKDKITAEDAEDT